MTLQAQQKVLSSKPDKLYKKPIGLRDIKAAGLRENYAKLIDNKYNEDMCPNPPLCVWVKAKNYYPLGTRIEREFIKNKDVIYDATITYIDLETKIYILKWDDKDKHTKKEDNYTCGQIGIYLHPIELSKFEVGEMIRKRFNGLWHEGSIESVNKKYKLYHVKYDNSDAKDMTITEIGKHWVKPDKEKKGK